MEVTPNMLDDKGDFKIDNYLDITEITIENLKKDKTIITLGGDHSITYPIIYAMRSKYNNLFNLHIDAHSDLYQEFEGTPIHMPVLFPE
ncbi:arginase family protein [Maribacter sp. CXY002]|uniref:arginase family protein n=1 Tax=Maribacter luteocoastalis TaxID=3407671 RepID=UPI003B6835FA